MMARGHPHAILSRSAGKICDFALVYGDDVVESDELMKIGVCYYPEHWLEEEWANDARAMVDAGIEVVRIGEFAWYLMEPEPGYYDWAWLDRAIGTLADAGLQIILGTPTATPPKWLVDRYPELLAKDQYGRVRQFGSRRHYCFSSPVYRQEVQRIVGAMAERYGMHEALYGWQTDNEYGCHDTVRSYSQAASIAFRDWLSHRYRDIAVLNRAWGTVFWSQTYRSFDEVELPNLTVTEPNPSHMLDFFRFSSDQVVSFNRLQTDILRTMSPDTDIYHNFMGHFTDFDHFALSSDIDVASWDSYPLGFLDQENYDEDDKRTYMRQGHPDFSGFHHDLYRGCGRGRFAVMEQQPGPVNWAPNNPAPLPGMLRLWGHEVHAHGGEMISYFRWRQVPFAQENLHAGLMRHDNQPASGLAEVRQLSDDLEKTQNFEGKCKAKIALVFSYETIWMSELKPQGQGWDINKMLLDWYSAVRQFGYDVDIVAPGAPLNDYQVVLVPSLMHVNDKALQAFYGTQAQIVFGPRSGAYTVDMHLSDGLAPGVLQQLMPVKVIRSESFPEGHVEQAMWEDVPFICAGWLDHIESDLKPLVRTPGGYGLVYRDEGIWMVAGIPVRESLRVLMKRVLTAAGLDCCLLPEGVRLSRWGSLIYAVNYSAEEQTLSKDIMSDQAGVLIGERKLAPAGVTLWRE